MTYATILDEVDRNIRYLRFKLAADLRNERHQTSAGMATLHSISIF